MAIRGYKPKSFLTKDTINKVKRQLNKMSERSISNLSVEELVHIRDISVEAGERSIYKKTNSLINKKALGLSGWDLRKANEEQLITLDQRSKEFEPIREMKKQQKRLERQERKRLKEIQQLSGVTGYGNQLMINGVVSPGIVGLSEEDYIKERKSVNKKLGHPENPSDVEKQAKKDYAQAIKLKDRDFEAIDKESIKHMDNFLDNYFQVITDANKRRVLDEYVRELSVQQRYDLRDVLKSEKFKEEWDSGSADKDADDYEIIRSQKMNDRYDKIISILRNQTGKDIRINKSGEVVKSDISKNKIQESNKFNNYI